MISKSWELGFVVGRPCLCPTVAIAPLQEILDAIGVNSGYPERIS
jgi:hypothetical protein